MKKGLIFLPVLIAGLMVTGCDKKGGKEQSGIIEGIPESGTGYYLTCDTDEGTRYINGKMAATYYLGLTETKDAAVTFKVETSGENFTLQVENGSNQGKYLALVASGTHVNAVYQAAAYDFTWHEEELDEGTFGGIGGQVATEGYSPSWYLLGNQPGKDTVGTVFKKYWPTNYLVRLEK